MLQKCPKKKQAQPSARPQVCKWQPRAGHLKRWINQSDIIKEVDKVRQDSESTEAAKEDITKDDLRTQLHII